MLSKILYGNNECGCINEIQAYKRSQNFTMCTTNRYSNGGHLEKSNVIFSDIGSIKLLAAMNFDHHPIDGTTTPLILRALLNRRYTLCFWNLASSSILS